MVRYVCHLPGQMVAPRYRIPYALSIDFIHEWTVFKYLTPGHGRSYKKSSSGAARHYPIDKEESMKVIHRQPLDFFDLDHTGKLHLTGASRLFQSMAARHSLSIGADRGTLGKLGVTWLLHRLQTRFLRYPEQGEELILSTWSRGFRRHLGLREYEIRTRDEVLVQATSVWVFYDIPKERVCSVQPQVAEKYQFEAETAFESELHQWRPCGPIQPEREVAVTLRHSDFDLNGHVNNTLYPGFMETLYHQLSPAGSGSITGFKLRFRREIPLGTEKVMVGCRAEGDEYEINIHSSLGDNTLYADGSFSVK